MEAEEIIDSLTSERREEKGKKRNRKKKMMRMMKDARLPFFSELLVRTAINTQQVYWLVDIRTHLDNPSDRYDADNENCETVKKVG